MEEHTLLLKFYCKNGDSVPVSQKKFQTLKCKTNGVGPMFDMSLIKMMRKFDKFV